MQTIAKILAIEKKQMQIWEQASDFKHCKSRQPNYLYLILFQASD